MRRLHILLDGLPGPDDPAGWLDRHAPSLHTLLARGRALPGETSLSRALAREFGLGPDLPIAPHTLAMDGLSPDDALWLRADPVCIQFHQDQLVPLGPERLDVQRDEADALIADLQGHFAAEGLVFHAPVPQRWYLRLNEGEALPEAEPLDAVEGLPLQYHLPRGPAAAVWHRRLNEVQMLLHDHPVNRAREADGRWPINGVWFWGGGRHVPLAPPPLKRLAARHVLAQALAGAAGMHCAEPEGLDALLGAEAAMVILELPAWGDAERLTQALQQTEQRWFRPALSALRRGAIRSLGLTCTAPWRISRELTPLSTYRVWQRALKRTA
ncbi:MAG: hypothetical protein ACUVT2_06895 [Thiobacillaceae bacterium]